jgi:DNA modification methylase
MTFMGQRPSAIAPGLKPKDAVLMPFRVALAAQAEGWWVRSVIIWHKPNPMPESVRDRPTDAHEYIFLLTRAKNYWYDADAVREPLAPDTAQRYETTFGNIDKRGGREDGFPSGVLRGMLDLPNGRNCRSVWTFPTQGFPDAHFAVFPRELPERCIKAGAPVDGVVLDPFVGSGTTCEVAYHLGRTAIGIDASAKYLDMAIGRVKQGALL